MSAKGAEIVGTAVVLVDKPRLSVADDDRRIATGAISDRRFDMDRNAQPAAEIDLLAVDRAHEVGEAEVADATFEFVGRIPGHEHGDVARDVRGEPFLVEVVGVEMGDVEVVGVLHSMQEVGAEPVVAGEDEPAAEERRFEPGVADDRPEAGLDQDAGVAERRCQHARGRT